MTAAKRHEPRAGRAHLVSVDQIVDLMRARIRDLVAEWELKGHVDRHDFVALSPLRADRHLGSFRVCLDGPYRGMVKDFASGQTWTPLSFTAELWFRGDNVQAIKWAKGWLGIDGTDPDALRKTRRAVEQVRDEPDVDAQAEKYRALAYRRYLEAQADILDTPVERYLRGRGLDVRRLPFPLRALRCHPGLMNQESGRAWPAMVAPIVGADGKFLSVHRTWLEVQADGRVVKAPLGEPKKTLGRYRGGLIRLWNGLSVHPETGEIRKARKLAQASAGTWLDMTEGIEDGVSVALALPELRVVAGVSIDNMAHVALPDCVEGVTLWAQNDPPDSVAAERFGRVVDSLLERGRRVCVVRPPEGRKDANEVVQHGG